MSTELIPATSAAAAAATSSSGPSTTPTTSAPPPYRWTQELASVSVSLDLPQGAQRAKDIKVEIGKRRLKVSLKSSPSLPPLIDGELYADIKQEDSTWSVEDGVLSIELEKLGHRSNAPAWWPHVLTHDPKIDTSKIEPESSKLGDLDGETRGMVEKMMFDNQQKQLGKPTSDELAKLETLERFKKQHPEMDFSRAKMS